MPANVPQRSTGTVTIGDRSFPVTGLVVTRRRSASSRQRFREEKEMARQALAWTTAMMARDAREAVAKGHQYVARISRRQATRRMRSLNGPLMQR
jgi:hypothetical protein